MSTTIAIPKICEFCGMEFTAQTTVTRFCGHKCAARSYKQRKKENKIGWAIEETNKQKVLSASEQFLFQGLAIVHILLGEHKIKYFAPVDDNQVKFKTKEPTD